MAGSFLFVFHIKSHARIYKFPLRKKIILLVVYYCASKLFLCIAAARKHFEWWCNQPFLKEHKCTWDVELREEKMKRLGRGSVHSSALRSQINASDIGLTRQCLIWRGFVFSSLYSSFTWKGGRALQNYLSISWTASLGATWNRQPRCLSINIKISMSSVQKYLE